jgi:hypothetical protein
VRELVKGSTAESNFRGILKSFIDMINLTGRVEFISILSPVLREDLEAGWASEMNAFVRTFIQESFLIEEPVKDINLI